MRIFCFEKNIYLNSIKNDHADGCRSGCGLIRSILGILELSSEKKHTFITIWKSWFSYEFPLFSHPESLIEMHLASKSFCESGQESGRLVTEQNMRALSLDRHEWEDFAV